MHGLMEESLCTGTWPSVWQRISRTHMSHRGEYQAHSITLGVPNQVRVKMVNGKQKITIKV